MEEMKRFLNWGKIPMTPYPDCCCQFTTQYLWPFTWHVILHSFNRRCIVFNTEAPIPWHRLFTESMEEGMLTSRILMAMYLKGVSVKYQRGLLTQGKTAVISSWKYLISSDIIFSFFCAQHSARHSR